MKCDVVLAGVGGHGTLSLGWLLAEAARIDGLRVSLSELHGMAQRGGSVLAHLRLADSSIHSAVIRTASANVLLATEPLEALRYVSLLAPDGAVVVALEPDRNIPDYPNDEELKTRLESLAHSILVETRGVARAAGVGPTSHLVLAGAVCGLLPITPGSVERVIEGGASARGEQIVQAHLAAFRAGQEQVRCPRP